MKKIKQLLARLIGKDNILSNNVLFIDYTNSHEKAQFLSQLFYWSQRTKMKDGFFAKTYDEWFDEIRIKKQSLRRYAREFQEKGLLEIKFKKFNEVPTLHYKLNEDKLIKDLLELCETEKKEGYQDDTDRGYHGDTFEGINLIPSREGITVIPSTNRDLHILQTERERAREKSKTNEKPPWEQSFEFWKSWFIKHPEFVSGIKTGAPDFKGKIIPILKDYLIHLQSEGESFALSIPKTEEEIQCRASKIQGMLIKWANARVRREKEKNGQQKPIHEPPPGGYYTPGPAKNRTGMGSMADIMNMKKTPA